MQYTTLGTSGPLGRLCHRFIMSVSSVVHDNTA